MKVITIGRHSSNDVVIDNDGKVSRHHLQIIQDDNGNFRLADFGSMNGTFVNGSPVTGEFALAASDIIRIGNTTLPWKNYFGDETHTRTAMSDKLRDVIVQKIVSGRTDWTPEELQYQLNYPQEMEEALVRAGQGFQHNATQIPNGKGIIGIELGITKSRAAVWSDGKVAAIPNHVTHNATDSTTVKLQQIKKMAEYYLGMSVKSVITVPSFLTIKQRQAIFDASEMAKLKCLRLISIPVSVALAHYFNKPKDIKVAILYFENGTLDVAIFEIGDGVFEVRSSNGCMLVEENINLQIKRIAEVCEKALKDANNCLRGDIDELILIGSSAYNPLVQETVKKIFGKTPSNIANPDIMPVIGTAILSSVLTGEISNILLLDVIPISLGIETAGGVMTKLIEHNSTIPHKKSETFSTAVDNQPSVAIHVLQGENEKAADNETIGRFQLDGIPLAPKGVPQIEVVFDIDQNGMLCVSAKDKGTGKQINVKMNR
jgi:molecular chaperone DnaK (HSP70)